MVIVWEFEYREADIADNKMNACSYLTEFR